MMPHVPPFVFRHLLIVLLVALCARGEAAAEEPVNPSFKDGISTAEIVLATTNFECMKWRLSGVCLWLECSPFCTVKVSPHVSHYAPALVVASYGTTGQSPWSDFIGDSYALVSEFAHRSTFALQGTTVSTEMGGGAFGDRGDAVGAKERRQGLRFKAADVVGSPGNIATMAAGFGLPLFCPTSDIQPLYPYFLSGIDAISWTSATIEALYPASLLPGRREVGSLNLFPGDGPLNPLGNTWGSLFPRTGFIDQPEDPKAGAVIAQRAADIVYKESQPHIYRRVGTVGGMDDGGFKVWEPGELRENDPENSVWQMLVPITEDQCSEFGVDDRQTPSHLTRRSWADGKNHEGDYVFMLWRPYDCCKDEGSFITRITF